MINPKKIVKKIHSCPECGKSNLIEDRDQGEIICKNCGIVISESMLSTIPEWRAFTKEEGEKRSRIGGPISFSIHDKGLSTMMKQIDKDAYGKTLSLERRMKMRELRKWHRRVNINSSKSRNLVKAMAWIDMFSDKLHIPSLIKEKASIVYRKALDAGLVRGRSIAEIAVSAIYTACRSSKTPRTLKEIADVSGLRKKDIARCYRLILNELKMKMPIDDPLKCVSKITAKLNLTTKTQIKALEIIREAKQNDIVTGKDPMGLAAAAIYIACLLEDEKKTQKEISEAAFVTEVTVRNRYKHLKKKLRSFLYSQMAS